MRGNDHTQLMSFAVLATVVIVHGAALYGLNSQTAGKLLQSTPEYIGVELVTEPAPDLVGAPHLRPVAAVKSDRSAIVHDSHSVARSVSVPATDASSGSVESAKPSTAIENSASALPKEHGSAIEPNAYVAADFKAAYLNNVPPHYPTLSRRLHEEGVVRVRALVTVDGAASLMELERSSGFSRLDDAALQSVAKWRFVPGRRGGTPIESWVAVPVVFTLTEGKDGNK